MSDEASMVAYARDLVSSYDALITRMKYIKEIVKRDPDRLELIMPSLRKLCGDTLSFLSKYSSLIIDEKSSYARFLKTYHDYLVMISVPYALDLLIEIRDKVSGTSSRYVEELDRIINELSRIGISTK